MLLPTHIGCIHIRVGIPLNIPTQNFGMLAKRYCWKRHNKVCLTIPSRSFLGSPILSSLIGPSEQCDAFCALVYYVHILGDHLEGDKPDKLEALEPLAQYESLSSPGIIPELQEYLQVLFADQKTSWAFMSLMQGLDTLGRKAEKVYYSSGGINTEEKCAINMENAKELLTLLGDYIPELLKNEDFFIEAFFS